MALDQQIEAVLFYKASPLTTKQLSSILGVKEPDLTDPLEALRVRLEKGATRLVTVGNSVELVTASEFDGLIENLRKDDMRRDIGKAGAETLAIVLYRGPVVRAEIDRIRGVNSSFILRNLQIRGLVSKDSSGRQTIYKATTELYNHLGIQQLTDLPEFESIMNALDAYEKAHETENV